MNAPTPDHELLSAYLDDELSPEDRARVEERLATDPEYAAMLEAFRDQQMRLQSLPKGSINVRQRVMDAIGDEASVTVAAADVGSKETQSTRRFNPWALASLAALLLLGAFLFVPNRQADQAIVQNEISSAKEDLLVDDLAEVDAVAGTDAFDDSDAASMKSSAEGRGGDFGDAGGELAANEEADSVSDESAMSAQQQEADEAMDFAQPARPMAPDRPSSATRQSLEGAGNGIVGGYVPRSRSAPMGATPVPAFADNPNQSFRLNRSDRPQLLGGAAGAELFEGAATEGTVEKTNKSDDAVEEVDPLEWMKGKRIWILQTAPDQSEQRLTIARLRKALDEAGCTYREVKPATRVFRWPNKVNSEQAAQVKREDRYILFAATATPKQLVKLRELSGEFASIDRLDFILSSVKRMRISEMPHADWDGSKLPRDEALDPPGDGRTYLFYVYPEEESPAAAAEIEAESR